VIDRINAILAAGYNFSLLIRWLAGRWRNLIALFFHQAPIAQLA
jgi:hypothetical protein